MEIAKQISNELNIALWQTEAVIELIDSGNTIPLLRDTVRKNTAH